MAYIGNSPTNIQRGRRAQYHFTASVGQTAFTGTDDNGLTLDLLESVENDVYFNGARLILDDDYTISGDTLTLTAGAAAGDILVIVTQDDIVNLNSYTKAEADDRYINYTGDIINGNIQVVGNIDATNITSGDVTSSGILKSQRANYAKVSLVNTDTSQEWQVQNNGTNFRITDQTQSGATRLAINATGYVGIGTIAPAEELDISADAPSIQLSSTNASGRSYGLQSMNTGKLGIYDANAGLNRIVLDSSGNVGIGTTSPQHLLHISSTGDAGIHIQADTNNVGENDNPYISFSQDGDSSQQFKIGMIGDAGQEFTDSITNACYIHAANASTQPLQLAHNGAAVMTLANGRVGIGADPNVYTNYQTTIRRDDSSAWPSPSTGGASGEGVLALINNNTSSFTYSNLVLRAGTGDCGIAAVYQNASNNSDLVLYTDAGSNGKEQIRLTHEGNVGIGTTSPNQSGFGSNNRILSVKTPSTSTGSAIIEVIGSGNNNGDNVGIIQFLSQSETNPLTRIRAVRYTSDAAGSLAIDTNGTQRMVIDSTGTITMGVGSRVRIGSDETRSHYYNKSSQSSNIKTYAQSLSCYNQITSSGTWYNVCFVSHSPALRFEGMAVENDNPSLGGGRYMGGIRGTYGAVSVYADSTFVNPMNGGTISNFEYRYTNSSPNYTLQVRVTYSGSYSFDVYTNVHGLAVEQIYEHN